MCYRAMFSPKLTIVATEIVSLVSTIPTSKKDCWAPYHSAAGKACDLAIEFGNELVYRLLKLYWGSDCMGRLLNSANWAARLRRSLWAGFRLQTVSTKFIINLLYFWLEYRSFLLGLETELRWEGTFTRPQRGLRLAPMAPSRNVVIRSKIVWPA